LELKTVDNHAEAGKGRAISSRWMPDLEDTVGGIQDKDRQNRLQHFSWRASLSFPSFASIFPCHTSIVASEWNLSKVEIRPSEVSFRMDSCNNRLDLSCIRVTLFASRVLILLQHYAQIHLGLSR
jgi:hypothetical protein